jgi:hypothetical protein
MLKQKAEEKAKKKKKDEIVTKLRLAAAKMSKSDKSDMEERLEKILGDEDEMDVGQTIKEIVKKRV